MDKFISHLEEKRAKLRKQLQRLEGEIADLDKAERLYRESGAAAPQSPPKPRSYVMTAEPASLAMEGGAAMGVVGTAAAAPELFPGAGKTIKQRVMQLLERNSQGLTSSQILNVLGIDGGSHVSRESLSPQLTRLKTEGLIYTADGLWIAQKHETPAG